MHPDSAARHPAAVTGPESLQYDRQSVLGSPRDPQRLDALRLFPIQPEQWPEPLSPEQINAGSVFCCCAAQELQEFEVALAWAKRAVAEATDHAGEGAPARLALADALLQRGVCESRLGEHTVALATLRQSLDLRTDELSYRTFTLTRLSDAHAALADWGQAITWYTQAQSAAISGGMHHQLGHILLDMARCHHELEQYDQALAVANSALEPLHASDDNERIEHDRHQCVGKAYAKIATIHCALGQYDMAMAAAEKARAELVRADHHGRRESAAGS